MQHAVQNAQIPVGRNYIDMARFDLHPVLDLDNWHGGATLEQLHQQGLAGRVQVLDDHEGQPTGGRHMAQEQFQRLQSPGGSADADDGKSVMSVGRGDRGRRGTAFCFGKAGGRLGLTAKSLGGFLHG